MAAPALSPTPPEEERTSGLTVAVLVMVLVGSFAILPRLFPSAGVLDGKDAPDLGIPYVANAPAGAASLSMGDLRGHAVLLDFWATWCGPCQQELPIVERVAKRYGEAGLTVIGVNTSDEAGNAAPFVSRRHISYPIAYDEGQRAAAAYKVDSLPTLVLISKTGKVLAVRTGITGDAELDALVKRAL